MVKTVEEDEDDDPDDDVKAWNNERRPNKPANSLTTIEQLRPHDFRSHNMRPRTLNLTTCFSNYRPAIFFDRQGWRIFLL
ncbi:hypothetical protein YC2023_043255 [Brassica napus]